jgi:hypothetical protein
MTDQPQYLIPPHCPTSAPPETLMAEEDFEFVLDDLEG